MNPLWRCVLTATGVILFCLFVLLLQVFYTIRHHGENDT